MSIIERNDIMTIVNIVRERRKELNLTQTELAEKTGLTQTYLSMLENGKFEPTAQTIIRLAAVLTISTDELLGINNTKNVW